MVAIHPPRTELLSRLVQAERVRMRQQVQKMDEVQRRVYERNMQEEKMRKAAEEERMKQGEEERRRQREVTLKQREESRRKFEEWSKGGEGTDGNKPKKDLTDEEVSAAARSEASGMKSNALPSLLLVLLIALTDSAAVSNVMKHAKPFCYLPHSSDKKGEPGQSEENVGWDLQDHGSINR
mmetsp:Transcript_18806/g.38513  ORF Transcript_18806/g.38513 Transcript_18806/m.38513 type:complete len:181 (-) Transcript_18806:25-567(-)